MVHYGVAGTGIADTTIDITKSVDTVKCKERDNAPGYLALLHRNHIS